MNLIGEKCKKKTTARPIFFAYVLENLHLQFFRAISCWMLEKCLPLFFIISFAHSSSSTFTATFFFSSRGLWHKDKACKRFESTEKKEMRKNVEHLIQCEADRGVTALLQPR